jgi:hypothetical protein
MSTTTHTRTERSAVSFSRPVSRSQYAGRSAQRAPRSLPASFLRSLHEPLQACRHPRTVDPREEIERRLIAPLPQVCAKAGPLREAGTLLRTATVSLLGNTGHELEDVPLVALGKGEEPPITKALCHVIHTVAPRHFRRSAHAPCSENTSTTQLARRNSRHRPEGRGRCGSPNTFQLGNKIYDITLYAM